MRHRTDDDERDSMGGVGGMSRQYWDINIASAMQSFRPPPSSSNIFFDEFTSVLDSSTQLPGQLIICKDFNAPGSVDSTVDVRLQTLFDDYNLAQY